MRIIVGLFGIICGAVVVGIVARYGYKTAASDIDGMITATLFGIIAAGGLGGHAVAVHVWRRSAIWSLLIGVIAMLALLVNLTNSLGFIAGRGDSKEAERVQHRDQLRSDRTALDRTVRERERMATFTPATPAAVAAARAAVSDADAMRTAECEGRGGRGARCRDREADVRKAREMLVAVETNLALTETAAALDRKIEDLRTRIAATKPIAHDNPQAAALGLLFSLPASTAGTYQQLAVAIVVELLIVAALVAFELMREASPQAPRMSAPAVLTPLTQPAPQAAQRPLLVVSRRIGAVEDFLHDCLQVAKGKRTEVGDVYATYRAWCARNDAEPMPVGAFAERFATVCADIGVTTRAKGEHVFCVGVTFAAA